jgi:hypothetical protein
MSNDHYQIIWLVGIVPVGSDGAFPRCPRKDSEGGGGIRARCCNVFLLEAILLSILYKTECLFVCIFCMQIYSFTPILMKFCTLDLQNKKKITVYFNFTKTNPYYHFQPC